MLSRWLCLYGTWVKRTQTRHHILLAVGRKLGVIVFCYTAFGSSDCMCMALDLGVQPAHLGCNINALEVVQSCSFSLHVLFVKALNTPNFCSIGVCAVMGTHSHDQLNSNMETVLLSCDITTDGLLRWLIM